ncbi:DUF2851 family protein [Rufibacter soli]
MKEDFLHYVWRHQYFLKDHLCTTAGEEVVVLHPGFYNRADAGPDFSGARLLVGQTEWVGSVELHLLASDWRRHRHQQDGKYNQVVLHVVWEEDEKVQREEGSEMPTLELRGRVDLPLQARYQELLWSQEEIPCAGQASVVNPVYKSAMMDKTLLERLEQKADLVLERFTQTRQDWESTVYQTMAAGFGFKINQQGFTQLTQLVPLRLVTRYRHSPSQLEALIYGQAGLLGAPDHRDAYLQNLALEHYYLTQKHSLPAPLPQSAWNYLRLRPANFPAVRVGQWLAVLQAHHHLWADLVACESLEEFLIYFRHSPPLYWQQHYAPGKTAAQPHQRIGEESIQGLLINIVGPLLMTYSRLQDNVGSQEKAVALLENLPKEQNKITRLFAGLGFPHTCAADSQALLGLYQNYCAPKKCLHCSIGHRLLKQNQSPA